MLTLNLKATKIAQPFLSEQQLLRTYRPFISKTVHFDISQTLRVLGLESWNPLSDVSTKPTIAYCEDLFANENTPPASSEHRETQKREGIWSDPPIEYGELEVDCPRAIAKRWGDLDGVDAKGWIGYLQCGRDVMESEQTKMRGKFQKSCID